MKDKLATYPADPETILGLVEKGLIRKVGTDPFGNPVYENTELGNMIADELEDDYDNLDWENEEEIQDDYEYDEFDDDEYADDPYEWDEF